MLSRVHLEKVNKPFLSSLCARGAGQMKNCTCSSDIQGVAFDSLRPFKPAVGKVPGETLGVARPSLLRDAIMCVECTGKDLTTVSLPCTPAHVFSSWKVKVIQLREA